METKHVLLTVILTRFTIVTAGRTVQNLCHTTCKCDDIFNDFWVDCSYRNLTKIPANIPSNTSVLILQGNNISEVEAEDLFGTPDLTLLNLSENLLEELPGDLFKGTVRLETLLVSNNLLAKIAGDTFKSASNLISLNLSENKLKRIPTMFLHESPNLKRLILASNEIAELPEDIFYEAENLQQFDVQNNQLVHLNSNLFLKTAKLSKVLFSENRLRKIPEDLFLSTPKLEYLDISQNLLQELGTDTFKRTSRLKKLYINQNILEELGKEIFHSAPNLRFLQISQNLLRDLDHDTFKGTPALVQLDLSENLLHHINSDMFRSTKHLQEVYFSSNSLSHIPAGIFNATPYLNKIDFSMNRLKEVPKHLFSGLNDLVNLFMSGNNIEIINQDLFTNVFLVNELDFANNSIRRIPDGLFKTNVWAHELKTIFLQRNKLTFIQKGCFDGLPMLSTICLFNNRIEAIDSGAFSMPSLTKVFLFENNLQRIENSSFDSSSLGEIHLYRNNIEHISEEATAGLSFRTLWFLSCELLRNVEASNMKIECVTSMYAPGMSADNEVARRLELEGFTCNSINDSLNYHCELCKRGMYSIGDNHCYPCPRGGFYQDEIGFKSTNVNDIGCKRCNDGNFVKSEGATSAKDCEVCPPGTNKSMAAGFRACFCKDGYARYDRFGPCYLCNQTGLNCSGLQDYQTVSKGYYWGWKFQGADREMYVKFVKNLLQETKYFDKNTFYYKEIPRVHKCPRPDSCNFNQSGLAPVLGTCSKGYGGWLCNKCSRGYFSLLKQCVECPSKVVLIIEVLVTSVVTLIVCYLIWTQYAKHKKRNPDQRNLWDIILSRMKIILGFYQVLAELFSSLREVRWVGMFDFMAEILSVIQLNILRFLFRPQCFHESLHINPKAEFLIALSVIFCLTAVPFFFYNIKRAYLYFTHVLAYNQSCLENLKAKLSTICLMLLFVTYPPISTAIFQLYHRACVQFCSDLKNQSCMSVLRSDFELHCEQLVLYQVFAYLATAAYIIAFPVVLFYLLRKYCSRITTTISDISGNVNDSTPLNPLSSYGTNIPIELKFLVENYKPQFWYWEILELTRKVTQTVLLTLLGWEDKITVLLTIGVSVLFLTLHARYRPMKSVLEQRLQMFALCAILINVLVAAMTMTFPDGTEEALAVILFLLNVSVFVILISEAAFGVAIQIKKLKFYRRVYDPTPSQGET